MRFWSIELKRSKRGSVWHMRATSLLSPARATRRDKNSPIERSLSTTESLRRRCSPDRAGVAMTNILIGGMIGLVFCLFGTPLAIKSFRRRGWGQLIREEGPKAHYEK